MAHTQERTGAPIDSAVARLLGRYRTIRNFSNELCASLETEDYVIQTMPDVSPTKWHMAHTSWFFETFILEPYLPAYETPDPRFRYLFNSYYNAVGDKHPRPNRGFISRPTVAEVFSYRTHVDEAMSSLFAETEPQALSKLMPVMEVGLNHEQQHQELLLTDIKHVFSANPSFPIYKKANNTSGADTAALEWTGFEAGQRLIGHKGEAFAYDNETPQHRQFLEAFQIASRLVTNGEFQAFIDDGGYRRPELWLSDGWNVVQERGWTTPLYWHDRDGEPAEFTLSGLRAIRSNEPVTHVSYYEADAYARWAGARLPYESEWEVASADVPIDGNFVGGKSFHPAPAVKTDGIAQMFGDAWEWTQSHYSAYPGYKPPAGAIGEYNGKFMCNQFVLRGGSCVTSLDHIRRTYRNFFPADARWQFTGIRLARDSRNE